MKIKKEVMNTQTQTKRRKLDTDRSQKHGDKTEGTGWEYERE